MQQDELNIWKFWIADICRMIMLRHATDLMYIDHCYSKAKINRKKPTDELAIFFPHLPDIT